jgi:hypothetical protein
MIHARTMIALAALAAIASACAANGESNDGPQARQNSALVTSVKMVLSIQSSSRVMTGGAGDGLGRNKKQCCLDPRTPLAACAHPMKFDGTTLSAGGVFHYSGVHSSATGSGRMEGPYNCVDGTGSEWEFPPFLDGVADTVNQEVARIEYWDVNPSQTFPSSLYTFQWREVDEYVPDDFYEWRVQVANWINSCSIASQHGNNGTYTVDTGLVNGGRLCDRRGCDKGEYRVAFSVECAVSGGSSSSSSSGGGGNNNVCFPSYNACAAVCQGVCERRINCGGPSAHKCFE